MAEISALRDDLSFTEATPCIFQNEPRRLDEVSSIRNDRPDSRAFEFHLIDPSRRKPYFRRCRRARSGPDRADLRHRLA